VLKEFKYCYRNGADHNFKNTFLLVLNYVSVALLDPDDHDLNGIWNEFKLNCDWSMLCESQVVGLCVKYFPNELTTR